MSNDDTSNSSLSRRAMIKVAGTALVGVWSHSAIPAIAGQQPTGSTPTGKSIMLAPDDSKDPAVHSRVENLFWCDMMMEHAGFFSMLMPGLELAAERGQAEAFQRTFQAQYDRAKTSRLDLTNHAAFNRSTIELIKPFIEYKKRMGDAQESGKIRTLVFPLFFEHTAREAGRASTRLDKLAHGNADLDFKEVIGFWSETMSDHGDLIAHLLDPGEEDLIGKALDSSAVFDGFHHGNLERRVPGGQILLAAEELIDFQTAVEDGINAGRIKSILHPTLAGHMRRESLKFVDELKRSASRT